MSKIGVVGHSTVQYLAATAAVSFTIDMRGFCKKYSGPEVALLLVYFDFCTQCGFSGPEWFDALDLFHFYRLSCHYISTAYMFGLCFVAIYLIVF